MFEGECVVARVNAGTLPLATGGFARGAIKGFPDIVLLHKSKFYGIEVKNSKGKLSSAQNRMKDWIENNGGIFIVARDVDTVKEIF